MDVLHWEAVLAEYRLQQMMGGTAPGAYSEPLWHTPPIASTCDVLLAAALYLEGVMLVPPLPLVAPVMHARVDELARALAFSGPFERTPPPNPPP